MKKDDYLKREFLGQVASKSKPSALKSLNRIKRKFALHGKRVVFVTPYSRMAKEEAEKWNKKGIKAEIKRERDDRGKTVYVVYIFQ
ncbi:MAG: hypothetical protein ABIH83_01590 [Candidatus Micrarchaeota archaeon]